MLAIDGPGGSGKTTLAAAILAARPTGTTQVVHMDDLYDGWSGLSTVAGQLNTLLRPLARGEAGCYRRYDWHVGAYVETVPLAPLAPVDLLVVEGVGSGAPEVAGLVTLLVWVEAPRAIRLERGLARDGDATRERWLAWQRDEDDHLAGLRTRERADLLVDGAGALAPRLGS